MWTHIPLGLTEVGTKDSAPCMPTYVHMRLTVRENTSEISSYEF